MGAGLLLSVMHPHLVRRSLVFLVLAYAVGPGRGAGARAQVKAEPERGSEASLVDQLLEDSVFNRAGATRAAIRGGGTTTFRPGRRLVVEQLTGVRREQTARLLADCDRVFADTLALITAAGAAANPDDVAVAAAFYISIAHHLYWRDLPDAPPEPKGLHLLTLSERLRGGYLARGTFLGKSDEEKQAARDRLLLSACGPLLRLVQLRKSTNQRARASLREEALAMLDKVGLSPQSLRFQPGGVVVTGSR